MRLIDITNSYANLVSQQLAHTDSEYVKVYSLGRTTVVFSKAPTHYEVLFKNETRNIQKNEINFVIDELITDELPDQNIINGHHIAEVTIPIKK